MQLSFRDLHITTANIIGFTLFGVLVSTLTTQWWSCGDDWLSVLRAWTLGATLGTTGVCTAIAARHYRLDQQMQYYLELSLRLLLVFALVTTALLKAEGHFYNYTLFDGETKLANLEADTFANAFYGFSPMFQSYVGYAIIAGLAMICFRQTQRVGNLLLAAILVNAVMLNISFNSCFVYKNGIYLAVVSYFIYNDLPAYFAFFGRVKTDTISDYHPLEGHPHLRNSSSMMKAILLVGLFFYNHDYIEDSKNFRSRNADNPITGVWDITDVKFLASDVPEENTKEILNFNSIILDKGRYGAVGIADSLSFFEYLVIPDDNHLEIWNFQDFYSLDIKGRYTQISEDSIVYLGRNNQDSLIISLKKHPDSKSKN